MGYQKPIISDKWVKNRNVMTVFKDGIHYSLIENKSKTFGAWQTFKVHKSANNDTAFFFTNIYIAGNTNANDFKEIESLFETYKFERYLITGDMNAKNILWDSQCQTPNGNGTKLCNIIKQLDYTTVNNGEHTRISEFEGHSNSAIDLTIVSGSLLSGNITWKTHNDAMGSDHKPQLITMCNEDIINHFEPPLRVTYKTDQADPDKFKSCFTGCEENLKQLPTDIVDNYDEITQRIISHIVVAANDGVRTIKKPLIE